MSKKDFELISISKYLNNDGINETKIDFDEIIKEIDLTFYENNISLKHKKESMYLTGTYVS